MKISEIFIVIPSYSPNTATTNRIMALIRGFSEQGQKTHVTFLISDSYGSKVQEDIPCIDFTYMWEGKATRNRFLTQLQLECYSRKYISSLPKEATVFLPWPSSRLLSLLVKRKDLRVYYEETEFPELYSMKLFNIRSYFKAILKLEGVFVISSGLKEYFLEHKVPSDKIHIINMVVDMTRFTNILKEKGKERYIAYCGTVTSTKDGVDVLLKAFSIVNKKHPDLKLYIIGPIPGANEQDNFINLASEMGLMEKVHFTGLVSYEKMPQMLKNAEVLVLARPDNIQAKYGFPTKLGEYLLTGNPVVVTKVGDIPLFLIHKDSAYIAEPNCPTDFADKICYVLDNHEEAMIVGQNGQKVAEKNFNYMIESKKILRVIDSTN